MVTGHLETCGAKSLLAFLQLSSEPPNNLVAEFIVNYIASSNHKERSAVSQADVRIMPDPVIAVNAKLEMF